MISKFKYGLTILLILATFAGRGQNARSLIDSASVLFSFEKIDSSKLLFEQALEVAKDPSQHLEAIHGLLKVAVFMVYLDQADSLYLIGASILKEHSNIEKQIEIRFNQSYAELLRKQAKFSEALALHKKMLAESKKLPNEEKIVASGYLYVSATYEVLQEPDSALYNIEKSYEISSKIYPENHVKMTSLYNLMGSCYYRTNDFDNAEIFYQKAIDNAILHSEQSSYFLPMAYGNLAVVYNTKGDYETAIEYVKKSLAINKALNEPDGIGFNYYSLAVTYYYLGDYGRSADYANECLNIRKTVYDENHYRLASPTELLGIVYEESGDFESAIEFLEKAKEIKIHNLGEDNIEVAYSNENIANCFLRLGNTDSALYYIQLAHEIIPKKITSPDNSLAVHYASLGEIKRWKGDYDEALVAIKKSNEIYRALEFEKSDDYAQNLALEASIYSEQLNFEKAQEYFDKSVNSVRIDEQAEIESSSFPTRAISLNIINLIIEHSFKAYQATGKETYLHQTKQYSDYFLEISDNFRKQFNDPYTKSIIAQKNNSGIELGVGINYQLHKLQPSDVLVEQVFNYAEIGRTSLFRDLIDDYKVRSFAGIPDSTLEKEKQFKVEINDYNQQLLEAPHDNEIRNKLFKAKEAFNHHIDNYISFNPNYYNLKFKNDIVAIKDIQKEVLNKEDNLIEYVVDDSAYYAILITKDDAIVQYLASKTKIAALIEQWRNAINKVDQKSINPISVELYRLLIEPLKAQFSGNNLIIIPTNALFYLNFEALKTQEKGDKYLIHDYQVYYALSTNVLYEQWQNKSKIKGVPIVVAPGFETDIKSNYKASVKDTLALDNDFLNTIRQPWSLKFAKYMSKKYKGKALTGDVASETNVKQNLSNRPIVHFATHAIADAKDPLRSKFVLAKDIGEQENDGYLHTYEIYNLNLQSELAVLTACESGIGNIQKGEGMISLAYSMNYAGCPSVIMSLWKIDEKTNAKITTNFYDYLAKGKDVSSALRAAKLDYLTHAKGTLSHPFYWSGLVLMGKNSTIELQSNYMNWKIVIPIILLFIGLVFLARKMRSKS